MNLHFYTETSPSSWRVCHSATPAGVSTYFEPCSREIKYPDGNLGGGEVRMGRITPAGLGFKQRGGQFDLGQWIFPAKSVTQGKCGAQTVLMPFPLCLGCRAWPCRLAHKASSKTPKQSEVSAENRPQSPLGCQIRQKRIGSLQTVSRKIPNCFGAPRCIQERSAWVFLVFCS